MARYGCTITVDTGEMPSSQTDFVWLVTADSFPTAAVDGGATSILNGGGNLRCYTDSTKATQLPIEVVTFVTGGTPNVQVWGLSGTLNVASTVYLEADTVATSQPAVTDTYGRNAVWADFEAVLHLSETGTNGVFTDSTGNGYDTTLTTGASLPTTSSGHPFGGTWPDFNTTQAVTLASSNSLVNNTAFTMSLWYSTDVSTSGDAVFGSRWTGDNWAQIQADGRVFTTGGGVENLVNGTGTVLTTYNLKLKQNSSILTRVLDGSNDGDDTSITDGESINNTSNNFRIGTYFDNNSTRRFNGRVGEIRVKKSFDSSDLDASEYNNQSDPSTFWVTGDWEDQDAGGFQVAWAINANKLLNCYN